jgi:long-chain acyl-CoA synthetase
MENNARYIECCGAGERAGLYFTCINSFLTADELAYIVNNSESRVLIFSEAKRAVALEALRQCPKIEVSLVVDGPGDGMRILNLDEATSRFPDTPIADESCGTAMLYSSGTTGRPKGIIRPLVERPPSQQLALFDFLQKLWRYREGLVYLSPAPLYHSAPQAAVNLVIRNGGTAIIMESFDPERYLQLVEKYRPTHSQLVPTMFSRMLKLPEAVRSRYDLSSLQVVIHAAAPCPPQVKEQMIGWWGPIIHEYYGATEGLGFAACDSAEWLAHRGTVGKVMLGDLHVLDEDMQPCPKGTSGTLWFKTATPFEYFNDPARTAEARTPDGSMSTVGDVGYVDDDGFLHLTDRATFMIVCGGVNIYPQECENLLITHPKVADAAVFGVPNEDLGEEVKAVVQAMPGEQPIRRWRMNCPRSAQNICRARSVRARLISRLSFHVCRPGNSTSACCATAIGATARAGLFEGGSVAAKPLCVDRVLDPFSRQRQIAQAFAGGIRNRICDRGCGRPLPGFAAAEERLAGAIDDVDLDAVGHRVEAQDRIGLPVDAGDPGVIETNAFIQRPAHRLHDRAFDLVDQPIRIDYLTAVDGGDRTHQTRPPGLPVHFHFGGNGAVGREILVARKGEPKTAVLRRFLALPPSERLRRLVDDVAPAGVVEMF